MLFGKMHVVTDGQWGSTGKGLIASHLHYTARFGILSTTNMANAGHTAVDIDDRKFVAKAIPSPAISKKWHGINSKILIGPSAAFTIKTLLDEIKECDIAPEDVIIHPRAGVITESHKLAENDMQIGTKHLASTMQGCGSFLADKIMRRKDLKLARDYPELKQFIPKSLYDFSSSWSDMLVEMLKTNSMLHEGSQGFSLDINHGSHFPQCTSRSTTAVQNLSDMGLPVSKLGQVILVIRPYPIRVGNVVEDGVTVGHSGDCYDDHHEVSWADVARDAGAPEEVMKGELTTVTKRLRRVFTFSPKQLRQSALVNGATQIALNFANYIDWSCYKTNKLSKKIYDFIDMVENITGVPVTLVGTGPRVNDVVRLNTSKHLLP